MLFRLRNSKNNPMTSPSEAQWPFGHSDFANNHNVRLSASVQDKLNKCIDILPAREQQAFSMHYNMIPDMVQ